MGIVGVLRGKVQSYKGSKEQRFFRSNFTEIHRVKKHKASQIFKFLCEALCFLRESRGIKSI